MDGHLGCFHVPAIVNSATMNTGAHGSFPILVFSGYTHSSMQETQVQSLAKEDPLEKGMAILSSTLALKIPMEKEL